MEQREIIRCRQCRLNQYLPQSKECRRCHKPLADHPPELQVELPSSTPRKLAPIMARPIVQNGELQIGAAIRLLREANNHSQRDLAVILAKPRTYISKIETGKACPNVKTLHEFAAAFKTTASALITIAQAMSV